VPTTSLILPFYEMIGVYGETIHKSDSPSKFGDAILSAIDFSWTSTSRNDQGRTVW